MLGFFHGICNLLYRDIQSVLQVANSYSNNLLRKETAYKLCSEIQVNCKPISPYVIQGNTVVLSINER